MRQGWPAAWAAATTMCVVALLLVVTPARAQDQQHAGLVVVHGDGRVTQQCIAFTEESISGYELLKRAGLAMSVEAGSIGATICSIEGEGCAFPQENCFCRCQGSPCTYWSYWRLSPDGWHYQNLGAGNTKVRDGDVEAWHWSEGTPNDASQPPAITFADLCSAPTPTPQPPALAVPVTPLPSPVHPLTPSPTPPLTIVGLVLIGLMVMPVAVIAVLVLLRKQQGK